MKHLVGTWICLILGLVVPAALCLPPAEDVNKIALEYVRSSQNYLDNGGFGEIVTATRLGEKVCVVVVEYQTRHVGMLQVIGRFASYITIDSTTLQVVEATTEDITGRGDEPGSGSTEPGNVSGDEPVLISPGEEESYRYKISYTINETREMIAKQGMEENLSDVLALLDRAQALLDGGEYDEALQVVLDARAIAEQFIYGTPVDEPGEEPGSPSEAEMPWLYGYIVVFDHEPTGDDWERLRQMFNATLIAKASVSVDENYSYWVRVSGVSPDELRKVEGIKDVLALRGDLINPAEGHTDVPELPVPASVMAGALTIMGFRRRWAVRSLRGPAASPASAVGVGQKEL